jgi:hypothetical protein
MWQEEIKVVVLIFLLIQYCRSENVLDLAEKLSRLENEMTSKITESQTEMIRVMTESEKLKRSMEILQDGNRLFDTRINSLNYVVRSQRFGTADVHNRTTHRTLAALSRIHVQYYYIYYFFWGFFCDYIVFVVCKLIFVSF